MARVQRATLIPWTSEAGTGIPVHTVTYLYAFHFFSWVNVHGPARGRARDTVGRRIKPGFYYKRIQIPRTHGRAPTARFAEACGAGPRRAAPRRGRETREREPYRNIKKPADPA